MANTISVDNSVVEVTVADARVDVNVSESVAKIEISSTGPQGPRGSQVLSGPNDPDIGLGIIGDQYINITTSCIFGPKTENGWGDGIRIGLGASDLAQVFIQSSPSEQWNITHTLSFIPNITIVDSAGTSFEGDYQYIGTNNIIVTFTAPTAGKAYLS